MKVGDYVRTKKGIAKIIDRINDPTNYYDKFWVCDRYLELNDDTEYIHEQDIIGEPKESIIDLIEVGDIIKFKELRTHITNDSGTKYYEDYICDIHSLEELENIKQEIIGKHIKLTSVITKEQFESMKYEVE